VGHIGERAEVLAVQQQAVREPRPLERALDDGDRRRAGQRGRPGQGRMDFSFKTRDG
jgi:hypothetical protein